MLSKIFNKRTFYSILFKLFISVTRGGNRRAPKLFGPFSTEKFCNFCVFYTKNLIHPQKNFMAFFRLLHKQHAIYHTKFPTYLLKQFYRHNLFIFTILPIKFINFFLLVSPLEMVSPGPPPPLDATAIIVEKVK